ncbi:hypothetical protein LOD99_53 [Oopsacas minuta]|uniref:Uncharacterized protein n=1 Tax=Oopsacas minuta TaxID=111878 RepID=A0AAV7K8I9_9METZ|nr:hypothetical protein LOD99_53 [Oopsacas minuta]
MATNLSDQTDRDKYIQQIEMYKKELTEKFIKIRKETTNIENQAIEQLDKILSDLKDPQKPDYHLQEQEIMLSWHEQEFKQFLTSICTIEPCPIPVTPNPVWTSAKRGSENDNIFRPHGLSIDPETNEIYIADCYNSRVQVFTNEGIHRRIIKHPEILNVHRILCTHQHLYVTDPINKHVYKLNKHTDEVLYSEELEFTPGGLDVFNNTTYISDFKTISLYLYDDELYKNSTIELKLMTNENEEEIRLLDIKILEDSIFTLLENSFYNIHTFDYDGNVLACLIPTAMVSKTFYFCIDNWENILLSSWDDNQVLVFTNKGKPISRIGNGVKGEKNSLVHPRGIGLLNTGALVVCDNKDSTCLHSYVYI